VTRWATTADISDSIAPSIAIVNAGASSVRIRLGRNAGICSAGRPLGMPWKRVSMVSTSVPKVATISVPSASARIVPGTGTRHGRRIE
jgi:hypothetical protein